MYYSTTDELEKFYLKIKLIPCPFCHLIGTLIKHGSWKGFLGYVGLFGIRGYRIFCNNRKRSKGCGKTFSLIPSSIIKGFAIPSSQLWIFLKQKHKSKNIIQAGHHLKNTFSISTIYRLWNLFSLAQSKIRNFIIKITSPPAMNFTTDPALQTIAHLESAFNGSICPVADFQCKFQVDFL
ncbi:MAG: hypothetical protein ACD_79C01405G0010 [uncultured bacterium]|nr:MAG: hypothetical protein ACD_79C01405G0010 [uncultured bacterium]